MITWSSKLEKLEGEFKELKLTHEATVTELTELKDKFAKIGNGEEMVALTEKFNAVSAEKEELLKQFEASKTEIETLKQKAVDFEKATTEKALSIVASQGIEPVKMAVEDSADEEIWKQFNAITNPVESRAFYMKHYNVLKAGK